MSPKRLTRNIAEKMIGGVAAGIADYFEVDKTLVRLVFVGLTLFGFGSVLMAYLVLWIIMPKSTQGNVVSYAPAVAYV